MTEAKHKKIDRVAVDALLVGIRNGLGYLGEEGAPILEKMANQKRHAGLCKNYSPATDIRRRYRLSSKGLLPSRRYQISSIT
jgi:hypothetical protein